jgi:hypothetical protein
MPFVSQGSPLEVSPPARAQGTPVARRALDTSGEDVRPPLTPEVAPMATRTQASCTARATSPQGLERQTKPNYGGGGNPAIPCAAAGKKITSVPLRRRCVWRRRRCCARGACPGNRRRRRTTLCRGGGGCDGRRRRGGAGSTLRQSLRPELGGFARQFELGSGREVLHVVILPVRAGKGLASHIDLAPGSADRHQAKAQQHKLPAWRSRIHHAHRQSPQMPCPRSVPTVACQRQLVCRPTAVWFSYVNQP